MKRRARLSGIASGYVHGFSPEEQDRLYRQARFFEKIVYEKVDFSGQNHLLEVGCGVGAQTEILLDRFPHLKIQGVDASPAQIQTAKKRLAKQIKLGQVSLQVGDALHLPYEDNSFDCAFVCWLLEHVQNPIEVLQEIRRVLTPAAILYCSEVLNATFYLHPYSPATQQYWFAFNDHQWNLKGDPFVGAKLANFLMAAGYQNVTTHVLLHHYDNRAPKKRAQYLEWWTSLLLSGAPALIRAGRVTSQLVTEMNRELETIKNDPNAVFFITQVQARAQAL